MKPDLTDAERAALVAVRDGLVERVYRADGNVVVPPRSVSARIVWGLIAKKLVQDARGATGATGTVRRCKMELSPAGMEALS